MNGQTTRYEIRDPRGDVTATHVRRDHEDGGKEIWWEQPDGKRGLNGVRTERLPLYGAEDVALWEMGEPILLVEGEKARGALKQAGFHVLATVTGASGTPSQESLSVLDGRAVILWPDADSPGIQHISRIAAALDGRSRATLVFEWAAAPKSGDAFDYLALGANRSDELRREIHGAVPAAEWLANLGGGPGVRGAHLARPEGEHEPAKRKARRMPSLATRIAALADDADLVHTAAGDGFASINVDGNIETLRLDCTRFAQLLRQRLFDEEGIAAPANAMSEAVELLKAHAWCRGPQVQVFTRIGEQGGNVYVDLANPSWEVIEVTPSGWQVLSRAPVRFQRLPGMAPLPVPERGGTVEGLRRFVNIADDDDWILLASWIGMNFRLAGPHPVLGLFGEQGSAKSTTARVIRALVDPNEAPLRSEPQSTQDLMISATNSWMQVFDNLSKLPPWLSDAFCRLATGGAFAGRKLYTNGDESVLKAQRPVLLTGIDDLATRGDLIDRALLITLSRIPEDRRRPEADFWSEFEAARPRLLGAFLDALSVGLRVHLSVRLTRSPRMADFASWSAAISVGFGWGPEAFAKAYSGNRETAHELALEGSPLATMLREWVPEAGLWQGTASELIATLTARFPEHARTRGELPTNPRTFANVLRRLMPNLRAVNVSVDFDPRKSRRRTITVRSTLESMTASAADAVEFQFPSAGPTSGGAQLASLAEIERHPDGFSVTPMSPISAPPFDGMTQMTQMTQEPRGWEPDPTEGADEC